MAPNNIQVHQSSVSIVDGSKDLSLRVLSGRVSKVKEWIMLGISFPVLFRIFGALVNETVFDPSYAQKKQTAKKVFILEDYHDSNQKIRCHFQEIDRDLGSVSAKQTVVVTGRMTHDGSLQVFNIENFNPEEVFVFLSRIENFSVRGIRLGLKEAHSLG